MLDHRQLSDIGFDYVLEKLVPFSPFGEELSRRISPYKKGEREALTSELRNVSLLARAFEAEPSAFSPLARALMQLKDIRRSVARSREVTLSDIELFEIKRFLMVLESLSAACDVLPVVKELGGISIFAMPEALAVVDPDGMRAQTFRLGDNLSDELRNVRRERKTVDLALRSLTGGAERERLMAERTALAAREENEEQRLRGGITRAFAAHSKKLETLIASIARLDFALAKARLMVELGGTVPQILPETQPGEPAAISFSNMVNPLTRALLREKGREFTPVTIGLVPGSTVITGANMGGKSVAVKTVALNTYLALSGLPVFCEKAELPMLSEIHLLAEDAEDSRGGLSSFGGEMVRFNDIVAAAAENGPALVLLDEFARGTNPHEGSALVRAAVRYFEAKKTAYALITTHFDDVACLAPVHYQVMGLRNADEKALEAALDGAAQEGGGQRHRLLARFMDYGLFRAGSDVNPPRDALKICRALRISDEFMAFVQE